MNHEAGTDVDVNNEDAFTLLKIGQEVDTPLGPGVIVDIEVQAGRYGDRVEMEPPVVTVELHDPPKDAPKRVVVCICKLGLKDDEHEAIIHKEFARLWPPITDEIPEDSRMIVDVQKEFEKRSSAFRARVEAMVGEVDPEDIRDACYAFIDLAADLPAFHGAAPNLDPGMVITDLEGVDLGGTSAIVLKTDPSGNGTNVVLYIPDEDEVKLVRIPNDSTFVGMDAGKEVGVVPTVYDPERLNSPELHPIRTLPDSYLRRDPNYPSSITNIWRPTLRVTPMRYYQTRDAGIPFKPENDPEKESHWPPTDYTNYPTPDFVPEGPDMPEYLSGPGVYEYDPARRHPKSVLNDMKPNAQLTKKAVDFWEQYQAAQPSDVHLKFEVNTFADMYASENDMDSDAMVDLLAYMYAMGFFPWQVVDGYISHVSTEATNLNTRTHYNNT